MDRVVSVERKNGVATVRFLSGDTVRVPSAVFLERRPRTGDSLDPDAYRLFLLKRGYPHALEAAMTVAPRLLMALCTTMFAMENTMP